MKRPASWMRFPTKYYKPRYCAPTGWWQDAFTLVELLLVLAIIGLLSAILLSSLAKAKDEARRTTCLANLRQLQFAYKSYSEDNQEALPQNISRTILLNQVNTQGSWVLGNARMDVTTTNLEAGTLFHPYLKASSLYRCPADTSTVIDAPHAKRTRSFSIQMWLNSDLYDGTYADTVHDHPLNLRRSTEIINPPQARAWVFIDEAEETIDDGVFTIGNPWAFPPAEGQDSTNFWVSYPAKRHSNGANLSFADGHAEHHRWQFNRTRTGDGTSQILITDPHDLLDVQWLQQGIPHTP